MIWGSLLFAGYLWTSSIPLRATEELGIDYIQFVGLEDTGHHAYALDFIPPLMKHCNRKQLPEVAHEPLINIVVDMMMAQNPNIRPLLFYNTKKNISIPMYMPSFPYGYKDRDIPFEVMKGYPKYDFMWLFSQAMNLNDLLNARIQPRYVYIERDWYDMGIGKCDLETFDPTKTCVENHATVQAKWLRLITFLYEKMAKPSYWCKIRLEWFFVKEQCDELARSLAAFFGWDVSSCDFEQVCESWDAVRGAKNIARTRDEITDSNAATFCPDYNVIYDSLAPLAPNISALESYTSSISEKNTSPHKWKVYDEAEYQQRKEICKRNSDTLGGV